MRIAAAATATLALSLLGLTACSHPWKVYSYPAWGFAISFRTPPNVTDTPAGKDGTPKSFRVQAVQGGRDLIVDATDASVSDKTDAEILREAPQTMIVEAGGTVEAHADVTAGKVPGVDVTIDRGGNPTERIRVFVVNRRLYQLITQSPEGPDDKEAATFLDSFRLTGP